jgi:hypothetical protein
VENTGHEVEPFHSARLFVSWTERALFEPDEAEVEVVSHVFEDDWKGLLDGMYSSRERRTSSSLSPPKKEPVEALV